MKFNMSGLFVEPCVTWNCECSPNGPEIPITDTCPQCGKPVPQNVRNFIYDQVKTELKGEIDYEKSLRKGKTKRVLGKLIPLLVIGVIILAVIGLNLLMPGIFKPVMDWTAGAWQWILDLPVLIPDVLGGCWQWLCDAFAAAGEFLAPTFGWLGSLLTGLWSGVCWLAAVLWELLLELIEALPEILGWLWEVLLFLGNQVWLLILFVIEAIPAVFALAIGLIGTLFQVLVMLLGVLWEAITGIFSLFF